MTPTQVAAVLAAIAGLVPAGWITAVSNQIATLNATDAAQAANDVVTDAQASAGADLVLALQFRAANAASGTALEAWVDPIGTSNVLGYCAAQLPGALADPNDWTADN